MKNPVPITVPSRVKPRISTVLGAKELNISVHTVKAHLEEAFFKMQVSNRVQLAVKYATDSKNRPLMN